MVGKLAAGGQRVAVVGTRSGQVYKGSAGGGGQGLLESRGQDVSGGRGNGGDERKRQGRDRGRC